MKTSIIRITSLFVAIGIICSCGGNEANEANEAIEKMIPAANVSIFGQDANAIKITGDVKLFMVKKSDKNDQWSIRALVPVENKISISGIDDIYTASFDLLDANYSIIHSDYGMRIQNKAVAVALLQSPSGSKNNLVFTPAWESITYSEYQKVADYINRCENINFEFKISDSSSNATTRATEIVIEEETETFEDTYAASTASSKDFDKVLDEYEEFVNSYVRLYKKAMNGDMSALTEYASCLEKAQSLSDELSSSQGDFTSAQFNRYVNITKKMTEGLL